MPDNKNKSLIIKVMSQAHNYNDLVVAYSLHNRFVLHLFSSPIIFQAIQKHHGEQCTSKVSQLEIINYWL